MPSEKWSATIRAEREVAVWMKPCLAPFHRKHTFAMDAFAQYVFNIVATQQKCKLAGSRCFSRSDEKSYLNKITSVRVNISERMQHLILSKPPAPGKEGKLLNYCNIVSVVGNVLLYNLLLIQSKLSKAACFLP